jgi:hypothetical protein
VSEPEDDPSDFDGREERSQRIARLGRRLLHRGDEIGRAVLSQSDKAKTEMVRMVAREVRTYLYELKLKEDLLDLARSHSLEVKISLSLKPLVEGEPGPAATPDAKD